MEARATVSIDGRLLASDPPPDELIPLLLAGRIARLRVRFVPRLAGPETDLTLTGSGDVYLPSSLHFQLGEVLETQDGPEAVYLPLREITGRVPVDTPY